MKKKITICTICKKEIGKGCDGKEYITEDMYGGYGLHVGRKVICKNSDGVVKRDGKLKYKLVSGHGNYSFYNIYSK